MLHFKSIICNLSDTAAVGKNNMKVTLEGVSADCVNDSIALARRQSVVVRHGFKLPRDVYKSNFFETGHHLSSELHQLFLKTREKPVAVTTQLAADPYSNNVPSDFDEEYFKKSRVLREDAPAEVNLCDLLNHYFSLFSSPKAHLTECENFETFIVFVNFVIGVVKSNNHLMVMGSFVYFDDSCNPYFECFVENNEVKISKYVEPAKFTSTESFLWECSMELLRENLSLQAKNHSLTKDNDQAHGRSMAAWIKEIFDTNKETIAGAVTTALAEPLAAIFNEKVVEPVMRRVFPDEEKQIKQQIAAIQYN
jgi:hypothetical protein